MTFETGIDTGDTAFMFACMALVQFMTPGLAFFYGGMVSSRNVIAMLIQSYIAMAIISVVWFAVGFSLTFGDSVLGVVGNPIQYPAFVNVPMHGPLTRDGKDISIGIPGILYAGYQCMFAIMTPTIMTGAFADRFRFFPYCVFISLWLLVVYCPITHWLWGGGWMSGLGIVDWAGGLGVQTCAGFSSIASLFFVGRRQTKLLEGREPHNTPFIALGTAMLWFGWYGFTGGGSYQSNGAGMLAALNCQFAAASTGFVWILMEVLVGGAKPSLGGFCVGVVAGLSSVTPNSGFMQPYMSVLLGFGAAPLTWVCVRLSKSWAKLGFEDALDVWGVHGMGGFFGTLWIGVFADGPECADLTSASDMCANPGTVTRSFNQFMKQTGGAMVVAVYSLVMTFVLLSIIGSFMTIVPSKKVQLALDEVMHGETAYRMSEQRKTKNALEAHDGSTTNGSNYGEEEGEEEEYIEVDDEDEEEQSLTGHILSRLGYPRQKGTYRAIS